MQTFLPYPSFAESARVLDRARLGKQRVETYQILRANAGLTRGWVHHPAAVMWRGHSAALAEYGAAMCREWIERGYNDTLLDKIALFGFPGNSPMPIAPIRWVWRDHPMTFQAIFFFVTCSAVWRLATGLVSMIKVPPRRMEIHR